MKKKLLFLVTCVSLILSASAGYTKQTLYKLGDSPFVRPPLASIEDLEKVVDESANDIKTGFMLAGYPELFAPFIEQFPLVDIETIDFQQGNTLKWMLYRKNNRVKVTKDVTWGAEQPFKAYAFTIKYQGQNYNMVVPFACVNFALASVTEAPAPVPVPQDTVQAEQVSTEPAEQPAVEPVDQAEFKHLRTIFDLGFMYQRNAATYLHLRFGAEYRVDKNLSFIGLLGGTPKLGDTDGASAFTVDLLANYSWDRFFVGAGFGGWLSSGNDGNHPENNKVDAIINAGYKLCGDDNNNREIFVEVRSALDEFDHFNRYNRVTGGLRLRF